jgi:hypothetical protein
VPSIVPPVISADAVVNEVAFTVEPLNGVPVIAPPVT